MAGHGTHCAGTVGGRRVGVAKGANIYGLKILGDSGEGSTSDILAALELVHSRATKSGRPSVVSMSLGGECENPFDCSTDSLVVAVENLYNAGIVSSVASGNSGCNGCYGSPNAAPHAVNVGATGNTDHVTYFSNYGQCIDIFAPGFDIVSAAAHALSGSEHKYALMSGTSMACPHVAGALALNFHKLGFGATPAEVTTSLLCDAARDVLYTDGIDTLSRSLLLQVPQPSTSSTGLCTLGEGCPSQCSGHGVCLSQRLTAAHAPTGAVSCYCDAGYYGSICDSTSTSCSSSHSHHVTISMTDAFGDGWSFASFVVSDSTGATASGALDSLCDGYSATKRYCFHDGMYTLRVESGQFPNENEWEMCGIKGGAPYVGQFEVLSSHTHNCVFVCDGRPLTTLLMSDSYGDGWNGAYYNIFSFDGVLLFGGSLEDGTVGSHRLCLPVGCSLLLMGAVGEASSEVSYSLCGFEGTVDDIVNVCVDETTGACTVSAVEPDSAVDCDQSRDHSGVDVMLFHFREEEGEEDGLTGGVVSLTITDPLNSNAVVAEKSLVNDFKGIYEICLRDGCYDVDIQVHSEEGDPVDAMWIVCGTRGVAPWKATLCVNKQYNFCYGLSNCPLLLSYAQRSDMHRYLVYHSIVDENGFPSNEVTLFGNVHGAHELCGLSVGMHSIYVGAGKYGGVDNRRNELHLCGQQLTLPVSATMSVLSENSSDCVLSAVRHPSCSSGKVSHDMVLLDSYGDGWGVSAFYQIRIGTATGPVMHTGKMTSGQIKVDELCLPTNTCFWLTVEAGEFADEILWVLCGYVGDAPSSQGFCTTDTTCEFINADDDVYDKEDDDDFNDIDDTLTNFPTPSPTTSSPTNQPTQTPTRHPDSPSQEPTQSPHSPTKSPSTSAMPTIAPSIRVTGRPSPHPSAAATNYTNRDTDPDYDLPIETFVLVMELEVRLKVSLLADESLDSAMTNLSSMIFLVESVKKVVFNAGLDTWNLTVTKCTPRYSHVVPTVSRQRDSSLSTRQVAPRKQPRLPNKGSGELICSLQLAIVPDPFEWLDLYGYKSRVIVATKTSFLTGEMQKFLVYASTRQKQLFPSTAMVQDLYLLDIRVRAGESTLQAIFPDAYHDGNDEFSKAFYKFVTAGPEQETHSEATLTEKEITQTRAEVFATAVVFSVAGLLLAYCVFLMRHCRVKVLTQTPTLDIGGAYAKVHSNRTNHRKFEILDDDDEEEEEEEEGRDKRAGYLHREMDRDQHGTNYDDVGEGEREDSLDAATDRRHVPEHMTALVATQGDEDEGDVGTEDSDVSGDSEGKMGGDYKRASSVQDMTSILTDVLVADDNLESAEAEEMY